jgi:hypothetical protein
VADAGVHLVAEARDGAADGDGARDGAVAHRIGWRGTRRPLSFTDGCRWRSILVATLMTVSTPWDDDWSMITFHSAKQVVWLEAIPEEWLDGSGGRGSREGAVGRQRPVLFINTEAFQEGTVGWAVTRQTITLPDDRQVSPRWTAVFHEDG